MSAILHIADGGTGSAPLLDRLQIDGIRVLDASAGDLGERLSAHEENFDAAVISASVEGPVAVARRVHASRPNTHIVFMTDAAHEAELRRELLLAPRIGRHWSVVTAEAADSAAGVIRAAVEDASRRRQLRTTLNRMNAKLAEPQPVKRRIVSDEFVATIFDQLTDAVIMVDVQGIVITANATASSLFGRDIVRGIRLGEALPELAEPSEELKEITVRLADGSRVVLEIAREQVTGPDGVRVGTAIVARDITTRRDQEERRRLLAEASDTLSQTLDMNEALQRFAASIVGPLGDLCVVDLVQGEDLARTAVAASEPMDAVLVETLRRYTPSQTRLDHPSVKAVRSGRTVVVNHVAPDVWRALATDQEHEAVINRLGYHSYVAAPIPVGEQVAGALIFVRGRRKDPFSDADVDLIRELATRAGTALHHAWLYHAADQANRAKDAFLATLSHELRTPMTSILGWVQILRMGGADEAALDEGLDVIEKSARVQAQLIEDLLDLSRINMGKLHMEMQEIELGEVARAALDTIHPAARAKNILLDASIRPDVVVQGDPNRLQQVVWNLLSNSVKFTPRGGAVMLTVDQEDSRARICVRDTGAGIEPAFLPMVFERFQQADSATTRKFGGLGLGLAIVRQVVELHGGYVRAHSEGEGKGATFTVSLPVPAVRRQVAEVASAPVRPDAEEPLSGICVLVVEDDAPSAKMIEALLTRAGARVELCDNVPDALENLRTSRPDLLISDIALPGQDGFDLIRQVRNRLRIGPERLPALALTAFGDVDTRVAVLGAGFQRHLQKPAGIRDIIDAALELVRHR